MVSMRQNTKKNLTFAVQSQRSICQKPYYISHQELLGYFFFSELMSTKKEHTSMRVKNLQKSIVKYG